MLNSQPSLISAERDLHLNLDKIKEVPFEELDREDKVTLVLVLLKQLQPYFSAQNLSVAPPVEGSGRNSNAGKSFDEGMAKILNNINVQTRKGAQTMETQLPPIKQRSQQI